jgi:hypothetical protein
MKPIDIIITGTIIAGVMSALYLLHIWPFN